jgi:plastocyanin
MPRTDSTDAILALLMGFILSAGIAAIVLSTHGFEMPAIGVARPMMAGPAGSAVQAAAPIQAPASAAAPPSAAAPVDAKVVATDLKFTPASINARAGQPVKITFENKGVIEHDLTFPGMKADKPADALHVVARAGQTATLEFTPTTAGKYEYVCTIPGHKEAGMKGTINVAP